MEKGHRRDFPAYLISKLTIRSVAATRQPLRIDPENPAGYHDTDTRLFLLFNYNVCYLAPAEKTASDISGEFYGQTGRDVVVVPDRRTRRTG